MKSHYCASLFGGAGVFDGTGVNGCGEDEPVPVVLGGIAVRGAVLLVVVGEEPLLAVLLLLFRPATFRKPIWPQLRFRNKRTLSGN